MTTAPADARTYVEWDVRNWSRALDFWTRHGRPIAGADAIELGSRGGGLSLWLAHRGAARVVCSDLHGPEPAAAQLHRSHGVPDGVVSYEAVDATDIPYISAFDIAVFKSVLGGIGGALGADGQRRAIGSIHASLRPGGQLWFAENLAASPLHTFARRRFVAWGGRWRYLTQAELVDMLRPFSRVQHTTVGFSACFGRNPRQQHLLAGLDAKVLEPLTPKSWRYIMIGVATK